MFLSAGDCDDHDGDHCIYDDRDYDHDDSDDCNADQTTCLSHNVSFPGEEGVKLSTMEETGLTTNPFDFHILHYDFIL